MSTPTKPELEQEVIRRSREQGISETLFRHAVAQRLGVYVTDLQCLGLLFFQGVATPTELAKHTGLTSGATTAMLDRLERAGLIKRGPNPKDRRGSLIVVDEHSKQTAGPLFASTREAQSQLLAGFSTAELQVLLRYFEESAAMWEQGRQKLLNYPKS